jgi:hypothetical protein
VLVVVLMAVWRARVAQMELGEVLRVAQCAEQINLQEGDVLFSDGDEGHAAYFIMTGSMTLVSSGSEIPIDSNTKPFGEIAFLQVQKRAGTMLAAEPSILLCIFQDDMARLFRCARRQPPLHASCLQYTPQRVRSDVSLPLHPPPSLSLALVVCVCVWVCVCVCAAVSLYARACLSVWLTRACVRAERSSSTRTPSCTPSARWW